MAITPDLKPDEFELTVLCPVGPCIVQHTYAFSNELKTAPTELKEAKVKILAMAGQAHKEGRHNV